MGAKCGVSQFWVGLFQSQLGAFLVLWFSSNSFDHQCKMRRKSPKSWVVINWSSNVLSHFKSFLITTDFTTNLIFIWNQKKTSNFMKNSKNWDLKKKLFVICVHNIVTTDRKLDKWIARRRLSIANKICFQYLNIVLKFWYWNSDWFHGMR